MHVIGKNDPSRWIAIGLKQLRHAGTIKNIVTQYECHGIITYKLFAYDKGLREPFRVRLLCIIKAATQNGKVTK